MNGRSGAQGIAAAASGVLFGLGLALAQMTDPRKVLGFLDIRGDWDPSLALVLLGAVSVTFLGYRYILKRPQPLFGAHFNIPSSRLWRDPKLLVGSTLFGIGWGIGGYCPGPALAQLAAPNAETWLFLPAMILGSLVARLLIGRAWAAAAPIRG